MAFNPTNPVSVGAATKKDHYDRAFDNTTALREMLHALAAFGAPFNTAGVGDYKTTDGVIGGTTTPTIYTAGAGIAVAIAYVSITNFHSAAVAVKVYAVENGGAVAAATLVHVDGAMPAGSTFKLPIPVFLDPSDTIRVNASVDNVVGVRVDALELTTVPSGITFKVIDGATILAATNTTLYTVPASGVTKAIVVGISHANDGGASATVIDYAPSAAANANRFLQDTLPNQQAIHAGLGMVLDPSDAVVVNHAIASVGARLAVVEFA